MSRILSEEEIDSKSFEFPDADPKQYLPSGLELRSDRLDNDKIVDKRDGHLLWFLEPSTTYDWMSHISIRDPRKSNNLVACQVNNEIYFYVVDTIEPGMELTVWFHTDLVQRIEHYLDESWKLCALTEGVVLEDLRWGSMSHRNLNPAYFPNKEFRFAQCGISSLPLIQSAFPPLFPLPAAPSFPYSHFSYSPCSSTVSLRAPPVTPGSQSLHSSSHASVASSSISPVPSDFTFELHTSSYLDDSGRSNSDESSVHGFWSSADRFGNPENQERRENPIRGHKALPYELEKVNGKFIYACDYCDKVLHQLSNLHAHRCTHTGERPFACGVCKKTFVQKAHLLKHSSMHTDDSQFSGRNALQIKRSRNHKITKSRDQSKITKLN